MKRSLPLIPLLALSATIAQAQSSLIASWASKDVHYAQDEAPSLPHTCTDTLVRAWRGERLGLKAIVRNAGNADQTLKVRLTEWNKSGTRIAAQQGEARFMNYVVTDNYQYCGYHPQNLTTYKVADAIDIDTLHTVGTMQTQPVWCTLEVPEKATPGIYKTQLLISQVQNGKEKVVKRLSLSVEVLAQTLPQPKDQQFHVDFWQQPYALSRWMGTERWSKAHMDALRPYLKLLARSGQKVVSTILFYEPWGDQSYDKFSPMVQTTKHKDGSWSYDYTVFDKWVELCQECGIDKQINCFSMVPWDMSFRYYDEAQQRDFDLKTTTKSEKYKELWTNFLQHFAKHLKEKGWFDKTCIAMDERGLDNMLDAYQIAQQAVPGIKMALAGTYHPELVDKLYDYCIGFGETFSPDELAKRNAKGWISTTYTCCSNTEPNLFSNSLPAEAAYLPIHSIANGFGGYLHWSWMNWDNHSLTDTRYRLFASGDTYLIYPGVRSSVRYERFIEGVAMAEKVRILRQYFKENGNQDKLEQLNTMVKAFALPGIPQGHTASEMVNQLQQFLNQTIK